MKAVVYARYGLPDVLRLDDVARPSPRDDQVLIKVRAVSVNASDWESLRGKPLYARIGGPVRPRFKILGSDIAGRVEAIGPRVTRWRPGDEVFGDNLALMGGFAEYACARETALAAKPAGMSFEEAAAIPQAGVIALQGIRHRGRVQPGQRVLVNGAGGGAGMFAVQLAKLAGAHVTGVDNAGKLDFVGSLGADRVLDYTRTDFTRTGERHDLVLDLAGHRSAFAYRRALAANGRYLFVGGSVSTLLQVLLVGPLIGRTADKKVRLLIVQPNPQDLLAVAELCQAGTIKPVIDRRYSLAEVPEALQYLGEGRSKGKLVITVD
ncbi:MAG TPA: NAD(P)-dependent alcohol dehydrogenase [Pilimelia sp.]|nr:NAD(P)-dependent alcohol dehydrogenase [Pilimelia sp.]